MPKANSDRQQAIDEGRKTYTGNPCKICGCTSKFVTNWACVQCSKENTSERNKRRWQRIKDAGLTKEYSRATSHHRKKYYDDHKDDLKQLLHEKKQTLGEFYIRKALTHIKSKCKKRNIPFGITVEDIHVPSHCPILGIELQFNTGGAADNSPSIDRIIPEDGYVPGNVIVISSRANRIKNNATIEEMFMIYKFYSERIA